MRLSIVAAVAENGVIGRGGRLPWHLSDDLKRFQRLTMGHTIVMGRRTWESIGRALPGRRSIVVSRQAGYHVEANAVEVAAGLHDALRIGEAAGDDEVFIVGGAELYCEALRHADRVYLTRIHAEVNGDTKFPAVDWNNWQLISSERHAADARNEFPFTFEIYERR